MWMCTELIHTVLVHCIWYSVHLCVVKESLQFQNEKTIVGMDASLATKSNLTIL